jgi:hypothetical protein
MIPHSIPIPDGGNDVQWILSRDIDCLIPSRVQISIDYSGLCQAFLILISEHYIGITVPANITSLEIFCLHNLDGEYIGIYFLLPLSERRCVALDHSCTGVDVDFLLDLIKLNGSKVDIVELDQ